MGYSYGTNHLTGRTVLACDICGATNGTTKKISCPVRYCQKTAVCDKKECMDKFKTYDHASCKQAVAKSRDDKKTVESGGITLFYREPTRFETSYHKLGGYVCAAYDDDIPTDNSGLAHHLNEMLGAFAWIKKAQLLEGAKKLNIAIKFIKIADK